uniref:F-box protein 46 n=1 Tax=Gasterosteus aculeatus aculeatus TaxID=481459 RepID=A0AAQ4Q566_GASAC|nr:F-box only protein 46 [Gasterosteus aculeatus aculeatus]
MDRDTFSHIRLWCPRPFGTYSQNKARSPGSGGSGGGGGGGGSGSSSLCKAEASPGARRTVDGSEDGGMIVGVQEENAEGEDAGSENTPPELAQSSQSHAPPPSSAPPSTPSTGSQVEDGRVLLDTWYVIKPGNTKEKIAFFVAHQFSGAGQPRPSAMKVKGNWATDCSKAKRRRRCSSYDPPTRSQASEQNLTHDSSLAPLCSEEPPLGGVNETDLLSVAEMVALVEQRTAMALQGIVAVHGNQHHLEGPNTTDSQGLTQHQHTLLRSTVSDPTPITFLSDSSNGHPSKVAREPSSPIQTDQELEEQQESLRVAQAIAHFESQNQGNRFHLGAGPVTDSPNREGEKERRRGGESGIAAPPPPPSHSHGEVRIAFRVSNLDPRSQLEPAGRSRCMFMSCGGGGNQAAARAKEKITCDLYQLVSPSSRDPGSLLLAATTAAPKPDGDLHHPDRQACGTPDPTQEEKKAAGRERVTGFHVEVVVTGAVDQCVFYGKDSTENVQEETVCFAMTSGGGGGGGGGGVGSSSDPSADDPPPGQLFFLQPPRGPEEEAKGTGPGSGSGICSLDCANNNGPGSGAAVSSGERGSRPDSPGVGEDCSDPSLCRLYSPRVSRLSGDPLPDPAASSSCGSTCCCCPTTSWSTSSATCRRARWPLSNAPATTSRR